MNRKNMYKFDAFSDYFTKSFLVSSVVFVMSVMTGTAVAQFADFDFFLYGSLYENTSFPLFDVIRFSINNSRVILLVFILSFLPFSVFLIYSALALFGFSFSYVTVFLLAAEDYFSNPVFYEHIISFALIFPLVMFYISYSAGVTSVNMNDIIKRKDFLVKSLYVFFISFFLSASVRSVIYVIFSIL